MSLNFVSAGFFAYFAVVFAAYWLLPSKRLQNGALLIASYVFYASFDYRFCLLLMLATLVGFVLAQMISSRESLTQRRILLAVGLGCNLIVLAVFKYFDFFARGAIELMNGMGFSPDTFTLNLVLPMGISFFLFKIMSYLIDTYRSTALATSSRLDFAVYVAFFPQLLAGPIDRAGTFLPQIEAARRFDVALAVAGTRQVLWGLFKKLALADGIAIIVNTAYGDYANRSGAALGFAAALYSFQIYCDFSGYTDISTGISKLLGIRPMRNFAYPYFSQSVSEFWRRWNISVSSWFRDYVYITLGGSRVSLPRLALNILLTFLLSGLWHGANETFLAWGAILGIGVMFTALRRKPVLKMADTPGGGSLTLASATKMLSTFAYVTLAWVFFRSESIEMALHVIRRILTPSFGSGQLLDILNLLGGNALITVAALAAFICIEWLQRRRECPLDIPAPSRAVRWVAYSTVIWATLLLMQPRLIGRFIYFDF